VEQLHGEGHPDEEEEEQDDIKLINMRARQEKGVYG